MKWFKEHIAVLSALGTLIGVAFIVGVSWTSLNTRVSTLEEATKKLQTPESARAKICQNLMEEWIQQIGSSFRNGTAELQAELDRYKCPELASMPVDRNESANVTNAVQK